MEATERESREFWAVTDDFSVVHVTGWSCAPKNPNLWRCPQVGWSGTEGLHLFRNRKAACAKAIENATAKLVEIAKAIRQLEQSDGLPETPKTTVPDGQ